MIMIRKIMCLLALMCAGSLSAMTPTIRVPHDEEAKYKRQPRDAKSALDMVRTLAHVFCVKRSVILSANVAYAKRLEAAQFARELLMGYTNERWISNAKGDTLGELLWLSTAAVVRAEPRKNLLTLRHEDLIAPRPDATQMAFSIVHLGGDVAKSSDYACYGKRVAGQSFNDIITALDEYIAHFDAAIMAAHTRDEVRVETELGGARDDFMRALSDAR